MVTNRSADMAGLRINPPRCTRTATDEADPRSQRFDGVKNSDREQWSMNKPLLNAVEDAPVQEDKK